MKQTHAFKGASNLLMKKAKRLEAKRKESSKNKWAIPVVIIIAAIIIVSLIAYRFFYIQPPKFQSKAAIVDQLSVKYPNPNFNQTATRLLDSAGFNEIDYYSHEKVTVEFYRNLPTHDYGIIILRVHSAIREAQEKYIDLFTSEKYTMEIRQRYDAEFSSGQLTIAEFLETSEQYVAIGPEFVRKNMKGAFAKTIIVMMGCNGIENNSMADALRDKGASVYVGWTNWVEINDTDTGIQQFLTYFLADNQTIIEAVGKTNLNYVVMGIALDYNPKDMGNLSLQALLKLE